MFEETTAEHTDSHAFSHRDIFSEIKKLHRERVDIAAIPNEYDNTPKVALHPLKNVTVSVPRGHDKVEVLDFTEQMEKALNYYGRTSDLETNTDRTNILQQIADKMTEGTHVSGTRVVIMNKGEAADAFVMPDGTIMISQSCINSLKNLDQIAAVIAHEVGHLLNETFQKKVKEKNEIHAFGVGWVHEMTSDAMSPKLLEKAGFNSLAFSDAIAIISGNERGSVHQSGLSRASQVVGQHGAVDYDTSSTPTKDIPPILKKDVKKTNLELCKSLLEKGDIGSVSSILPKLHPKDLKEVSEKILWKYESPDNRLEEYGIKHGIDTVTHLLTSRLETAGYEKEDIRLFLLLLSSYHPIEELVPDPESLVSLTNRLGQFIDMDMYRKMNQIVFENANVPTVESLFYRILEARILDVDFHKNRKGNVPVTKDSFLQILKQLSDYDAKRILKYEDRSLTEVLLSYIDKTYLYMAGENDVDTDQIREFFEEVKDMGIIPVTRGIYMPTMKKDILLPDGEWKSISVENRKAVIEQFFSVFRTESFQTSEIETFFSNLEQVEDDYSANRVMEIFLERTRKLMDEEKVPDDRRLEVLHAISSRIDGMKYKGKMVIQNALLPETEAAPAVPADTVSNDNYYRTNLKMIMGLSLFSTDSDAFYTYMTDVMNTSGIDTKTLTRTQVINLCQGLLLTSSNRLEQNLARYGETGVQFIDGSGRLTNITDINRFSSLPFIKEVIEKEEDMAVPRSLAEVNTLIMDMQRRYHFFNSYNSFSLFNDDMKALVLGRPIRAALESCITDDMEDSDLNDLLECIKLCYPKGPRKEDILKAINLRFLSSDTLSLEEKIAYVSNNFESVGPEGMVAVAEQITTFEQYLIFREEMGKKLSAYLEGSELVTGIALVDLSSSLLANRYSDLMRTCESDGESAAKMTTSAARQWIHTYFDSPSAVQTRNIRFDPHTQKFIVNADGRLTFMSFADAVASVKGLDHTKRFAIAHKALVEQDGALANDKSKQELGESLVNSLDIRSGFVRSVLSHAILSGEAKLVAFPAANMLSSLLFRAYDVAAIDTQELMGLRTGFYSHDPKKMEAVVSEEGLRRMLQSTTRELIDFGTAYKKDTRGYFAQLSSESEEQFYTVDTALGRLFSLDTEVKEQVDEKMEGVDDGIESIIRGVEFTGALGIRALQLSRQLKRFSPEVDRRLAKTFDRNPGLNKLLFWEYLYTRVNNGSEADRRFVTEQLITLDEEAGAGSLFSTRFATVKGEDGTVHKAVVKVLNPNAEAFVGESYNLTQTVLSKIHKETVFGKNKSYARLGETLVDLANQWCIRDINDPYFQSDDKNFRRVVGDVNAAVGSEEYVVPEVLYNSQKIKSEKAAEGRTLNVLLEDENIDEATKQEALRKVWVLFKAQFNGEEFNDEGSTFRIFHADPHVGNFIIGEDGKVNIIDRSMYLRLSEADIAVLKPLLEGNDYRTFLFAFVSRMLDVNKVRGSVQRNAIKASIMAKLLQERVTHASTSADNLMMIRSVMEKLTENGVEVPLEMQLMIRNIGAFHKLLEEYGLKRST